MKCPACGNTLEEITVQDVTVDVCTNGCAGIWFDTRELKKVDEKHESAGEELLLIEANRDATVDYESKRPCPKCDGITMLRHFMSVKKEIEVDECGKCGGIWLDGGELRQIRDQFKTEDDRKAAFNQYFDKAFSSELEEQQAKSAEGLEKSRKFSRAFRFICPSYYIPGKQAGGSY